MLFFVVSALTSTSTALAETATSGNLLPNTGNQACTNSQFGSGNGPAGVGCSGSSSNLSQGGTTNQGFDVRSGTGKDWGTSGTKDIESNGNITIGDAGSLENITVTKQNGGTTTTTADMLDGGVTLKSTTEQQNCEWQQSNYRCGSSAGSQDSFTVKVEIKDASGNVLATVEQTRNTDAGYNNNTAIHQDSVTYTGEGSRNYDWQWTGTDGNNSSNTSSLQGPNLIGAALEMTIADIDYTPTPPISEETQEEIEEAEETIEEVENIIENIPVEEIVEGVEEIAIEEPTVEVVEPTVEEPTVEIEEQAFQESFQENFTAILEEEGLTETFEEALVEEGITEEQFFEAVTEMVTEEFATTEEEPAVEEPTVEEEAPVEESPVVEEEPTTESETVNTTEESVETESEPTTETEPTESEPSTETSETEAESTESETESTESEEAETTEQEESTGNEEESVEEGNDEASTNEQDGADASVDTDSVESAVSEIEAKVQKVLKKLESKLKTLDQKLKVISIVTLQGMIETQPDMTEYANQQFYDTRKLEDNPDWYAEDTLLDAYGRSIYQDNTLVAYQTSDPVFQHTESINRVNETIGQLEAELEVLRNELNE